MPRGGANRLTPEDKIARGTLRPARETPRVTPKPLTVWPPPPERFSEAEREAWVELGAAVMELAVASRADLLHCRRVAQVTARVDAALADPSFKATALNALLKLETDFRKQLGLSPQARGAVQPLGVEDGDPDDPLNEFDA